MQDAQPYVSIKLQINSLWFWVPTRFCILEESCDLQLEFHFYEQQWQLTETFHQDRHLINGLIEIVSAYSGSTAWVKSYFNVPSQKQQKYPNLKNRKRVHILLAMHYCSSRSSSYYKTITEAYKICPCVSNRNKEAVEMCRHSNWPKANKRAPPVFMTSDQLHLPRVNMIEGRGSRPNPVHLLELHTSWKSLRRNCAALILPSSMEIHASQHLACRSFSWSLMQHLTPVSQTYTLS